MNEWKKKYKNKNLFSQRSWSTMGYVLAEEYSKKKKITKSYFFQTFFNFLFVIYMYNFLKVTSAVKFIICYY